MGHASISMTQRYIAVTDARKKDAAKLFEGDDPLKKKAKRWPFVNVNPK